MEHRIHHRLPDGGWATTVGKYAGHEVERRKLPRIIRFAGWVGRQTVRLNERLKGRIHG